MAINTTTSLSATYQKYFSKELLKYAIQALALNDYAQQGDLPKNVGAKSLSFFRRGVAASSNVQTLTEGTPIATFTDVTLTEINVPLIQYGEAVKITDILSYTQLYNALKAGIALMGEDAALKADDITRAEVAVNVTTTGQRRYSQQVANWAALAASSVSAGKFIATDLLDSVTQLKINRAPKIAGSYVGILPPQVTRDLMNDDDWLKASQYSAVNQLFKGEVGSLHGVRIVEATNPWREATGGALNTFAAAGTIYTSVITGMGAYAVAKLSGDSPMAPKVIISDKPDKSDPLNQTIVAGWKAYYAAKLLNEPWVVTMRSLSEWS